MKNKIVNNNLSNKNNKSLIEKTKSAHWKTLQKYNVTQPKSTKYIPIKLQLESKNFRDIFGEAWTKRVQLQMLVNKIIKGQ